MKTGDGRERVRRRRRRRRSRGRACVIAYRVVPPPTGQIPLVASEEHKSAPLSVCVKPTKREQSASAAMGTEQSYLSACANFPRSFFNPRHLGAANNRQTRAPVWNERRGAPTPPTNTSYQPYAPSRTQTVHGIRSCHGLGRCRWYLLAGAVLFQCLLVVASLSTGVPCLVVEVLLLLLLTRAQNTTATVRPSVCVCVLVQYACSSKIYLEYFQFSVPFEHIHAIT